MFEINFDFAREIDLKRSPIDFTAVVGVIVDWDLIAGVCGGVPHSFSPSLQTVQLSVGLEFELQRSLLIAANKFSKLASFTFSFATLS